MHQRLWTASSTCCNEQIFTTPSQTPERWKSPQFFLLFRGIFHLSTGTLQTEELTKKCFCRQSIMKGIHFWTEKPGEGLAPLFCLTGWSDCPSRSLDPPLNDKPGLGWTLPRLFYTKRVYSRICLCSSLIIYTKYSACVYFLLSIC